MSFFEKSRTAFASHSRAERAAVLLTVFLTLAIVARNPWSLLVSSFVAAPVAFQALGLLLVYRSNRVINFAQVHLGAVGAAVFSLLLVINPGIRGMRTLCGACADTAPGWLLALFSAMTIVVGLMVAVGTSWLIYNSIVRRFEEAPRLILTVATIFIAALLKGLADFIGAMEFLYVSGAQGRPPSPVILPAVPGLPFDFAITINGLTYAAPAIVLAVLAVIAAGGLAAYLRWSSAGVAIRASSENPQRAMSLGINSTAVTSRVWVIAGLLSGVASVLTRTTTSAPTAAELVTPLTAMVLAGSSFVGGLVSALLLSIFAGVVPYVEAFVVLIIGIGLTLRRARASRAEIEQSSAWRSANEVRPIPAELRNHPTVKRWLVSGAVLATVVCLGTPLLLSPRQNFLLVNALLFAMMAVSLMVLTGWAGQISLGQFAFAGIGAYITLLLPLPFPINLLAGALAGALVALLVGLPALRFRGMQLAVITLAFAGAVSALLLNPNTGLGRFVPEVVDRPTLLGVSLEDDRIFYYVALTAMVLVVMATRGLRGSRAARALIAARDNERAAQSYGIDLMRARLGAFAVSGFIAALAGGLMGVLQFGMKPDTYAADQGLIVFQTAIIGGLGSIAGPIIGAAFYGALQIFALPKFLVFLLTGGTGIVMLLAFPGGLGQIVFDARDNLLRRFAIRNHIHVPSLLEDRRVGSEARVPLKARHGIGSGGAFVANRYRLGGQWSIGTRLGGSKYVDRKRSASDTLAASKAVVSVVNVSDVEDLSGLSGRALVPTNRQLAEGLTPQVIVAGDDVVKTPKSVGIVKRARGFAASMDPRTLEGPLAPLMIMAVLGIFATVFGGMLSIAVTQLRADFGTSKGALVGISAVLGLIVTPLILFGGLLADRFRRAPIVRFGALLGSMLFAATAATNSMGLYTLTLTLAGVVVGVSAPSRTTMVLDYHPAAERIRVSSVLAMANGVGLVLGAAGGGYLLDAFGWRRASFLLGLSGVAASLLTFMVKEPTRGYSSDKDSDELPKMRLVESLRVVGAIASVRRYWAATPAIFIGRVFGEGFLLFVFLDHYQLTLGQFGLVRAIGSIGMVIGIAVASPFADRMMQRFPDKLMSAVSVTLVLQGVLFYVIATTPPLWLVLIITVVLNILLIVPNVVQIGALSQAIPTHVQGVGIYSVLLFQGLVTPVLVVMPLIAPRLIAGTATGAKFALPSLVVGALVMRTVGKTIEADMRAAEAAGFAKAVSDQAPVDEANAASVVVREVDVAYSGVQVLFGVDLTVDSGESVALLGTNGAGKSTLLRSMAGLTPITSGAIFIGGIDVTARRPHEHAANGVVMVPGQNSVFPTLTVGENLRMAGWLYRDDTARVEAGVASILAMFPALERRRGQAAGNLSGGEQRMVALGQAFMMNPRVLLIDELSIGLAPAIVKQLVAVLDEFRKEQDSTLVVVEQTLNTAMQLAQRAVFMEKGEVRFEGDVHSLERDTDLVRSVFVGGAASGRRMSNAGGVAAGAPTVLSVKGVSVNYGGVQALSNVNLSLEAGEVLGIIGPNGAGKTTLFDVISGFADTVGGSVSVDGLDVTGTAPNQRADLGLIRSFQAAELFPALTVRENIAVARERHLTPRGTMQYALRTPAAVRSEHRLMRRVEGLVGLLGLEAYADKFVSELSTGTRRVVDIACAMAAEPRILLLDEPSSGLAQAETEQLAPLIRRLVREMGCAIIVIDHDTSLISAVSDRLIGMALGQVISTGTPDEVLTDPLLIEAYLGSDAQSKDREISVEDEGLLVAGTPV
ncbi:MAG: ABC-type branched-subunit amino acid transport system ATPase component [Glaciecola sp.]